MHLTILLRCCYEYAVATLAKQSEKPIDLQALYGNPTGDELLNYHASGPYQHHEVKSIRLQLWDMCGLSIQFMDHMFVASLLSVCWHMLLVSPQVRIMWPSREQLLHDRHNGSTSKQILCVVSPRIVVDDTRTGGKATNIAMEYTTQLCSISFEPLLDQLCGSAPLLTAPSSSSATVNGVRSSPTRSAHAVALPVVPITQNTNGPPPPPPPTAIATPVYVSPPPPPPPLSSSLVATTASVAAAASIVTSLSPSPVAPTPVVTPVELPSFDIHGTVIDRSNNTRNNRTTADAATSTSSITSTAVSGVPNNVMNGRVRVHGMQSSPQQCIPSPLVIPDPVSNGDDTTAVAVAPTWPHQPNPIPSSIPAPTPTPPINTTLAPDHYHRVYKNSHTNGKGNGNGVHDASTAIPPPIAPIASNYTHVDQQMHPPPKFHQRD
jgi:hypothetical protein